jgi:hypothetical protein
MYRAFACSVALGVVACTPNLDEIYLRLLHVEGPSKFVDLGATYPDVSCLKNGKATVLGEVSDKDLATLAGLTRQREPKEPITRVAVQNGYAMTETGRNCHVPDEGRGAVLIFRKVEGAWQLIDVSKWYS